MQRNKTYDFFFSSRTKQIIIKEIKHAYQITKIMPYKKDELPYITKFITYENQTNLSK